MRRSVLLLTVLAAVLSLSSDITPQQAYIERWAETAVREMYRSGVPASITLSQGILESRSGLSALAAKGNNHFGIKCHKDWKGRTMKVDDDAKGECFRVYDSADESFRDHSDFLRYQDRYKFLFEFDTKDYESWAYGLKKAGYATDPSYPVKLIKIIEDYDLSKYDSMTQKQVRKAESVREAPEEKDEAPSKPRKENRRTSKKKQKQAVQEDVVEDVIPESPLSIEEPRRMSVKANEEFRFSLTREVYEINGVPFVYSIEGETYESIAKAFDLFPKEILRLNDLSKDERLLPGTVVFVQPKKSQAAKGLDKYIVDGEGESLREVCQRFGVQMKSVCKLNGWSAPGDLHEGDTIILRKK